MSNGYDHNGITQNTKISIAIVFILLGVVASVAGSISSFRTTQQNMNEKISEIENNYVPRNEIELQLKNINKKLD